MSPEKSATREGFLAQSSGSLFLFTLFHTADVHIFCILTQSKNLYTRTHPRTLWLVEYFWLFLPTLSQDVTLPGEWFRSTGTTRKWFRMLPGSGNRVTRQLFAVWFEMKEEKLRDGKKRTTRRKITFPLLCDIRAALTHTRTRADSSFVMYVCVFVLVRQSAVNALCWVVNGSAVIRVLCSLSPPPKMREDDGGGLCWEGNVKPRVAY